MEDQLYAVHLQPIQHIYQCYGFICDVSLTAFQTAHQTLISMPLELYFSRPSNSAFHNLCSTTKLPTSCHSLLGLGLNFCLWPLTTTGKSSIDLHCFYHNVCTKMFFAHSQTSIPSLFVHSSWEPPMDKILTTHVSTFCQVTTLLFHWQKSFCSNLLPTQRAAFHYLKSLSSFLVIKTDKDLGPVFLECAEYIAWALNEHLLADTYQQVSDHTATC